MRKTSLFGIALICAAAAAVPLVTAQDEAGPSETISYAAYAAGEGRVRVAVGSAIANVIKNDDFLPLEFAIGVTGDGPELRFTYDAFTLMDSAGHAYRVADPKKLAEQRKFLGSAQNYLRSRPMPIATLARGNMPVISRFYNKDGTLWGGTFLSNANYTQDILFFPRPMELEGVLTFVVKTEGMDNAVSVRFEVPGKKKKKKDKD